MLKGKKGKKREYRGFLLSSPQQLFEEGWEAKAKGHHISDPGNMAQDGCTLDEQERNLKVWSQSLPSSACRRRDCAVSYCKQHRGCVVWHFTGTPAISGHGSYLTGQLLCGTTDSSSTGSALPPHIWVMGSVQNFNQKLVKLGKNLFFGTN